MRDSSTALEPEVRARSASADERRRGRAAGCRQALRALGMLAKHDVGVGDRGSGAAAAVASRSGVRPRRLRSDAQRTVDSRTRLPPPARSCAPRRTGEHGETLHARTRGADGRRARTMLTSNDVPPTSAAMRRHAETTFRRARRARRRRRPVRRSGSESPCRSASPRRHHPTVGLVDVHRDGEPGSAQRRSPAPRDRRA